MNKVLYAQTLPKTAVFIAPKASKVQTIQRAGSTRISKALISAPPKGTYLNQQFKKAGYRYERIAI